jgi:hypothetical protein
LTLKPTPPATLGKPVTEWYRTPRWTGLRVRLAALLVVPSVLVFGVGALEWWRGDTSAGYILLGGWAVGLCLLSLQGLSAEPVRVGLSSSGVSLEMLFRTVESPWNYVAPQFLDRSQWRFGIRASTPGKPSSTRVAILTPEQGRALVNHPAAPRWVMPPEAREKWRYAGPGPET